MPYKSSKIKLSKSQDRRIKLTDEQREEIRHKYSTGLYSQRALAIEYKVSRRLITFIIDDTKYQRCKEQLKKRRADGRYKPTKEEWAKTIREHRQYKQKLYLNGELAEESEDKDENTDQ
jgi:hypothetical protein